MARSVCGICCILAVVVRNSLQLPSLSMTWYSSPWHTTPSMKTGAREAMAVSRWASWVLVRLLMLSGQMTEWGEEQQLLSCLGRSDTSTQHREWEVVTQSASVLHFNVLPPVPVWAGLANRPMRVKERREVERREVERSMAETSLCSWSPPTSRLASNRSDWHYNIIILRHLTSHSLPSPMLTSKFWSSNIKCCWCSLCLEYEIVQNFPLSLSGIWTLHCVCKTQQITALLVLPWRDYWPIHLKWNELHLFLYLQIY